MDYKIMEREFIERTVKLLDQYKDKVQGHVDGNEAYEVTLLMNCLLGLLVYPQQLGHKHKVQSWLTNDKVVEVGAEWGVEPQHVRCAGHKKKEDDTEVAITLQQLTIRQLIRQMRNSVAHASFAPVTDGHSRQSIGSIEFKDTERQHRFHLILPVSNLERFVRKLAESALVNVSTRSAP